MMVNSRKYLTVYPYEQLLPPSDPDQLVQYLLKELQRLKRTMSDLDEAAVYTLDAAPVGVVRYGTIRYAIGAWATALTGEGFYGYKAGTWTKIV